MTRLLNARGYSLASIVFHWLTAALVIVLFLTHEREFIGLHVSLGAIAGLFLLYRVWWRWNRGFSRPADQPVLLNVLARLVVWGFLLAIVVTIVTGYLLPWSGGRDLVIFEALRIPSPFAGNGAFHELMEEAHDIAGHAFLPLLALHVLGALKHAFVDKDSVLLRMARPVEGGK